MRRLLSRCFVSSLVGLRTQGRSFTSAGESVRFESAFPLSAPHSCLFDACYVLNLDSRTDRWQHIQRQIQKHKLASFVEPSYSINGITQEEMKKLESEKRKEGITLFENGRIQRVSGVDGKALCCSGDADQTRTAKNNNSITKKQSNGGSASVISESKVMGLVADGILTPDAAHRLLTIPNEKKLFGMDLTPGAVGCALGHMKIWEFIARTGESSSCATVDSTGESAGVCTEKVGESRRTRRNFLILEDDVEFSPSFFRTLRSRLSQVPSDYEVLYFGGLDLLSGGQPPRPFLRDGVRYAYAGHRELTAYVIRDAGVAKRMLEMSRPMQWQIDTHITERNRPCPLSLSQVSGLGEGLGETRGGSVTPEIISDPLSYVLQPSLAIQITSLGTDVQKNPSQNPALEDASRRLREFVAGGTSVR